MPRTSSLVDGCALSGARSARAASGYARKNPPPVSVLTLTASARVIPTPAHHRLGVRAFRRSVAKLRLSGWEHLRRVFRTDAAGCPHRVTGRPGTAAHPL